MQNPGDLITFPGQPVQQRMPNRDFRQPGQITGLTSPPGSNLLLGLALLPLTTILNHPRRKAPVIRRILRPRPRNQSNDGIENSVAFGRHGDPSQSAR